MEAIYEKSDYYKWYVLGLMVLTSMFVIAIPSMGMAVFAHDIARDLGLGLVQVGLVWGVGALPSIFTSLLGGAIGDKLGPKRVLIFSTLVSGILGASRGLAGNFYSMLLISLVLGTVLPFYSMNALKIIGEMFHSRQLGLANGLYSMGMALGFLLGAMLSATWLGPLLGGWRNVLFFYGLAGAFLSLPLAFIRNQPVSQTVGAVQVQSVRRNILKVGGLKNVWLLGLTLFGVAGGIQGMLGYLPLYLRNVGWEGVRADSAVSLFHTMSMLCVLPISFWSDRLNSRKPLLLGLALMETLGTGLLSVATGGLVWAAVLLAGFVRDAFMGIFFTMVIETEGVGPVFAGSAIGLTLAISGVSSMAAPPLGNSLAVFWPGAPFLLWAGLCLFGLGCLALVKKQA